MADGKPSRQQRIAAYKRILRDAIDQRPSGMRQKLAQVLGTHKSFISQITNPADATPIPARHLDAVLDVCHLPPAQRARFLGAYRDAHPHQAPPAVDSPQHYKTLHIQIPVLANPERQEALEAFIRDTVRRLCGLFDPP